MDNCNISHARLLGTVSTSNKQTKYPSLIKIKANSHSRAHRKTVWINFRKDSMSKKLQRIGKNANNVIKRNWSNKCN